MRLPKQMEAAYFEAFLTMLANELQVHIALLFLYRDVLRVCWRA